MPFSPINKKQNIIWTHSEYGRHLCSSSFKILKIRHLPFSMSVYNKKIMRKEKKVNDNLPTAVYRTLRV